jgi:hypothetical protein
MTEDFNLTMYSHYIAIFHETTNFLERSNARRKSNYFGRLLGISEAQLRIDKRPMPKFNNIIDLLGDGEE